RAAHRCGSPPASRSSSTAPPVPPRGWCPSPCPPLAPEAASGDKVGMTDERPPRADSARACLARLYEMDAALAKMEPELPDDMRPLGAEARRRVHAWLTRLG